MLISSVLCVLKRLEGMALSIRESSDWIWMSVFLAEKVASTGNCQGSKLGFH